MWSLGIILYVLMAKTEPYVEESINNLMIAIFSKKRPELSDNYFDLQWLLDDWILNRDPAKRITIKELFRYVRSEL